MPNRLPSGYNAVAEQYAVLGNPIEHSLSPEIHQKFAAIGNKPLTYEKLAAPLDGFTSLVEELHQRGFLGLNVTMPFKLQAFELADGLTERAEHARAVNTLIRTPSGWRGDNTDGVGLVSDLQYLLGDEISDRDILILGAGGSVQGILPALAAEEVGRIHIANRTASKATDLAMQYAQKLNKPDLTGSGLDMEPGQRFDILINATASGLTGDTPDLRAVPIIKECCYDLFYAATPTAFLRWCGETFTDEKIVRSDGLGMLVRQAAASYTAWHKQTIPAKHIEKITKELRTRISNVN